MDANSSEPPQHREATRAAARLPATGLGRTALALPASRRSLPIGRFMACSLSGATLVRREVEVAIGVAIVREGSAVQADIHVHSAAAIHTPHGTVVALT